MSRLATHYDNLQVARTAGPDVIKAAYRSLCQKWHPDRNEPANREACEKAMRLINAAYAVLSDPAKRRAHDDWIAEQEAGSRRPEPEAQKPRTPPADLVLQTTVTLWSELPANARDALSDDPANDRVLSARTCSPGVKVFVMALCAFAILVICREAAASQMDSPKLAGAVAAVGLCSAVIFHLAAEIYRFRVLRIAPRVGRTPTHFFEAGKHAVQVWPLFGIKKFDMTHHRVNGGYSHSIVEFDHAAGGPKTFKLHDEAQASALFESVHGILRMLNDQKPAAYFEALTRSPLFGLSSSARTATAGLLQAVGCVVFGVAAAAILSAAFLLPGNSKASRFAGPPPRPSQTALVPASPARTPPMSPAAPVVRRPAAAPGAVPRTGWYQKPMGLTLQAPLSIQTPSGHDYYLKVITPAGGSLGSLYIRGGEKADVLMPLGRYRMRYAYGDVWYSTALLFGNGTRYSELDTDLNFSESEKSIEGYEITLIKQKDGNLPERELSADAF